MLSFVGSAVAVVLAVLLIRRGNKRQGAAVIVVSLAIAVTAFAVFLETSNDGSNGSNDESQISAKEAKNALRQFQRAQAGRKALRLLRQLEAGSGDHSTRAKAVKLLASWTRDLVPVLYALKRRADLDRAEKFGSALAAGRRVERRVRPVLNFGRDARKSFLSSDQTPLVEAMVATGDAWTRWALSVERLLPSGGDFADSQRVADLSVTAIRSQRRAYRLAGVAIPAVWRTG